jgi:hypothetical protein
MTGNEFVRVGQNPVIIEGTADRPTLRTEYAGTVGAQCLVLKARHAQRQSHENIRLSNTFCSYSIWPSLAARPVASPAEAMTLRQQLV